MTFHSQDQQQRAGTSLSKLRNDSWREKFKKKIHAYFLSIYNDKRTRITVQRQHLSWLFNPFSGD